MIIRSLRLKNIKSYGEGPDGNGITIAFQPGINRVAGRNGHGKTTLIEALGYALFFSEPVFAERFALPTYFLRAGEKEGEIDVDFEHNGVSFRIERGLGQSRRKSKVIQLDDGSTCAEGDEPVAAYLCRLLASEKHRLNTPRQLCDLFSNLIGIRQGHLSRPFDSKPKDAKEFFDPLLDVEIFRESNYRLNEAQGRFKDLLDEQSNALSALQERIREREDTLEKMPLKEAQVEALTKIAGKSRKQKKEAELQKAICERKETEFNTARTALDKANHLRSLATQKREQDQQNLKDSQEAADRLKKTEPGYQAYLQAESSLRLLQQQQSERSSLLRHRADALNSQTATEGKMKAARQQLKDCKSRHDDKTKMAILLREQLITETARLEATQREFEVQTESHAAAKRARDAFEAWLATLPAQIDQNKHLLAAIEADAKIVAHWNAETVLKSRTEADRLEQAAQELGHKVAKAEEAKANLTAQLAQISGGMCPFLKEKCKQFNPQAIESDISEQEKAIVALASQHQQAIAASSQARKAWEKLAQQDSEITHLKKSLEEKVRTWIERHHQLFPSSAQQNWSVLHRFAPHELPNLEALPEVSFETQWLSFQSNFDPAKLRKLAAVQNAFSTKIAAFHNVAARLEARFSEFQKQHEDRLRQERDCQHHKKNLQAADEELKSLAQKIDQFTSEAEEAGSLVKASAAKVAEFDEKLQAFASLDQQFALQNQIKDRTGQDHKDYLGCRSLAEKLEERSELLKKSSEAETRHQEEVRLKQQSFETAQGAFDATTLESARNEAAVATTKLAIDERATQIAERELREEKERFKQWKQACSERDKINDEMARLRAAGQVARLAGKVLKDAAPAVAQHLCSRIAIGAQRIFNQINPEPIELEWKAEPNYSLRVTPGDRRFAMLSGGEQTKLALAMTLAMIEQFSGLRFAVFDEPTYGVDAESRDKLAEAVIDLQKAAGLNQLILVSHDNAFDGKIENVIKLQKSAFLGTELVSVA